MIIASLKNYRLSPRKVRLVANLVKGKKAEEALNILTFISKRAGDPLAKLVKSAIANAKTNFNIDKDLLFVKELRVDTGYTLKRIMPRARGMAYRINKRTSNISLVLAPKEEKAPKVKKIAKVKDETLKNK